MSFRNSMTWLHTWAGLIASWLLYFMFVTGSTGYFDEEITRWMQPEIPVQNSPFDIEQQLPIAEQRLLEIAPDALQYYIDFPIGRSPFYSLWWQTPGNSDTGEKPVWHSEKLDPNTGETVAGRETHGGEFLYRMHYLLHYLPTQAAHWITSLAALFMLTAIVSGIVIHRRIFKDFFSFRRNRPQRAWRDMHNLLGVLPLPFHLMITYSGLILLMFTTMLAVPVANYGTGKEIRIAYDRFFKEPSVREFSGKDATLTPLLNVYEKINAPPNDVLFIRVENPADQNGIVEVALKAKTGLLPFHSQHYNTHDGSQYVDSTEPTGSGAKNFYEVMEHLHEGLYAGPLLRWLYFLFGLSGAALIATGNILWAVRRHQEHSNGKTPIGLTLVDSLNVGVFAGLPIAIASYFLANRLLPVDFQGRADWEAHCLFIAWLLMLIHAITANRVFPRIKVWGQQLKVAAAIFAVVPIVDAVTSSVHLGTAMRYGDYVLLGFDLTMLTLAFGFYFTAHKVAQHKSTVKPSALSQEAAYDH